MIEDIIKNLETLRTLLAREAALARAMSELEMDNDFGFCVAEPMTSQTSFDTFAASSISATSRPTVDSVAIDKSLTWTGVLSHAASSADYVFNGRRLTTTQMEFVATVSPVVF